MLNWLVAYLQENNMEKDKEKTGRKKNRDNQSRHVDLFGAVNET